MKTFYEHFLNEMMRKLKAGEITQEKARKWCEQVKAAVANLPPDDIAAGIPTGH